MLALAFSDVHISVKDARKIPEKITRKCTYFIGWVRSKDVTLM
jgi:hypothetical protein